MTGGTWTVNDKTDGISFSTRWNKAFSKGSISGTLCKATAKIDDVPLNIGVGFITGTATMPTAPT
jgi:hypothetical protein